MRARTTICAKAYGCSQRYGQENRRWRRVEDGGGEGELGDVARHFGGFVMVLTPVVNGYVCCVFRRCCS